MLGRGDGVALQIEDLSHNVRRFTVNLEEPSATLGRHGHVSVMAHVDGQRVVRPYTPVSPPWQQGSFELVVKRWVGPAWWIGSSAPACCLTGVASGVACS